MKNSIRVKFAIEYATLLHAGQKRKYTDLDYITHPLEVARIVKSFTNDEDSFIAAILHDTLEDCDVEPKKIKYLFGEQVYQYVRHLSDSSFYEVKHGLAVDPLVFGNRITRKTATLERLKMAPAEVQTIKMADLIHNSFSIIVYDKNFAQVFLTEMQDLVNALNKSNKELRKIAQDIVNRFLVKKENV